jgi:hypothetical protein
MKRRRFIAGLGSAAAWPLVARAQQPAVPVIGFLGSGSAESWAYRSAFQQGLKEGGLVEDQNVEIEFRWANYDYNRLPGLATDLVRRQVSVIVAIGNNLTPRAAKAATSTIPIVFLIGADPVQVGLVASIGRPGANITGVTCNRRRSDPVGVANREWRPMIRSAECSSGASYATRPPGAGRPPRPGSGPDNRKAAQAMSELQDHLGEYRSLLLRRVLGEKLELDAVASLMLGVPVDPGARSIFAKALLANFLNSLDALAGYFGSKPIRRARAPQPKRDLDT